MKCDGKDVGLEILKILKIPPSLLSNGYRLFLSWVGPRADLDLVVKRKIPSSCHDWNPQSFSP
jgi:hypothetical protein